MYIISIGGVMRLVMVLAARIMNRFRNPSKRWGGGLGESKHNIGNTNLVPYLLYGLCKVVINKVLHNLILY